MARTECTPGTVDENAARIVAGIVVVTALVSLWPPAWWLVALLAMDFVIRGFIDRRYSPLRSVAKGIAGLLKWDVRPVYAPPKKFAARIGAALTVFATALYLLDLPIAGAVVTLLLVVAASLEAGFGFCLACWMYPYVSRFRSAQQAS